MHSQPKLSKLILAPGEGLTPYKKKNNMDCQHKDEVEVNKYRYYKYKPSLPFDSACEWRYPQATWAICTSDKHLMFLEMENRENEWTCFGDGPQLSNHFNSCSDIEQISMCCACMRPYWPWWRTRNKCWDRYSHAMHLEKLPEVSKITSFP